MPFLEEPVLGETEREKLRRAAVHRATYTYIKNTILISGNTNRPLEEFTSANGRFKIPDATSSAPDLTLLYSHVEGPDPSVTFLIDGSCYRIRSREMIDSVESTMMYLIMRHIKSHFIVHAGCLSSHGRGIILSGRSGMGKSTLTAHLAARGMGFLSDELAPINRRTGMIDAVPMPIGIRPGPARSLVVNKPTFHYSFRGDEKKLVDIETLSGKNPVDAVEPGHVVFLTASRGAKVATPKKFDGFVKVTTTGTNRSFERDLRSLDGITVKDRGSDGTFPTFLLDVGEPERFLPHLYGILEANKLELVALRYEDIGKPDFSALPKLTAIPAASGVIELVKKIPSFNMKEIAKTDFEGKLAPLIAELSSLLKNASFYKLSPGRIDDMIACLESLSR